MPDIPFNLDGRPHSASPDCTVAAAMLNAGAPRLRTSVTGEPRGPLCGMGICFECRVTIDGHAQQRSCQTLCRPQMCADRTARAGTGTQSLASEGLARSEAEPDFSRLTSTSSVESRFRTFAAGDAAIPRATSGDDSVPADFHHDSFDVLIVGAGPAGMAAACRAAEAGASVGVVDDNPNAGGQIWRGGPRAPTSPAAEWFERIARCKLSLLPGTQVFAAGKPGTLLANSDATPRSLHYKKLILATGARELFLPFPGWTLPNVMGAGALQAMVKGGLDIQGKRVILAGSGPLLLAVADYLKRKGATIVLVAEQTPFPKLAVFGLRLLGAPAKLKQAISLRRGVKMIAGVWPVSAAGNGRVQSLTLTNGSKSWAESCDYVGCGFGLVPNTELATLLGCQTNGGAVQVDAHQQTSLPNIFSAGESTGIGGIDMALAQGQIAGLSAVGHLDSARALFKSRDAAARFARALNHTFALRQELRTLAQGDTFVCRCEDVYYARLKTHSSWLDAKLQTRCGMGPCQGRVCGPAVEFLFGWRNTSVRPPVLPVELQMLANRE